MAIPGWSDWSPLGTPPGGINLQQAALTVMTNAINCLHVFCIGSDGNLWHIQQTGQNNGWGPWNVILNYANENLQAPIAVARNQDGRLEAFCLNKEGQVLHCWEAASATLANPSPPWSPLSPMPQVQGGLKAGVISAAANGNDGHLEVFAAGDNTTTGGFGVFHCWQTAPNDGWTDFELLVPDLDITAIAAAVNWGPTGFNGPGDTMEPFILANQPRVGNAPAGNLYISHLWQNNPGAGPWSGLTNLGSHFPLANEGYVPGAPVVGMTSQGALEVFSVDETGQIWRTIQGGGGSPDGWSQWSNNGQLANCQQSFGFLASVATSRLHVYAGPPGGEEIAPVDYRYQMVFALHVAADFTVDGVQFEVGQSYDEGGLPSDEIWNRAWQWNMGGGPATCIAVGVNQDTRSEVFIIVNESLSHAWMLNPTLDPLGLP